MNIAHIQDADGKWIGCEVKLSPEQQAVFRSDDGTRIRVIGTANGNHQIEVCDQHGITHQLELPVSRGRTMREVYGPVYCAACCVYAPHPHVCD